MWKLTIEDDEGKVTPLPLAHEEYGIGRDEANAIRLTDRNVSRKHAILKKNGQGWTLSDAQSYNGTFVNGARVVGEQPVNAGDIIQLGDYRIELLDETAAEAAAAAAAPPVPAAHQRPNRLVVVVGPTPGAEFPLDKEHFTIGRSEEATISINHSSVSRVHAELLPLGGGRFEIVDNASANGIRINGVELKRGILEAGDALELGDVRLRFVGQGKIFRADMSQLLTAVGQFDNVASSVAVGATQRGGMGKLIGAGVAALAVIIIALVVVLGGGGATATNPTKLVNKENKVQLEEALKLFDNKDIEGAHKKLMELPDEKRPSDDDGFKKIEAGWAQMKFDGVAIAPDNAKKKAILKEIASTDSVDGKTRIKATQALQAIEAEEKAAAQAKAEEEARARGPMGGGTLPGTAPTGADAVAPAPQPGKPTVVQNLPNQGPPDEAALRRGLEPKMRSGRASIEELKMLKAICSHMGDSACRDAAKAAIRAKQGD